MIDGYLHQQVVWESVRRGFNLIETAIVLGVVGLVIGGIWVGAAAVYERQKLDRIEANLVTAVSQMQRLFTRALLVPGGEGDGSNNYDVFEVALKAGVLTPAYLDDGIIWVGIQHDPASFQINYSGLSSARCSKLLVEVSSRFSDSGTLIGIDVNSYYMAPPALNWPVTLADALSYCQYSNNTVAFQFAFLR